MSGGGVARAGGTAVLATGRVGGTGPDGAALVPGSPRLLDPATNTYGTSVTIAGQGTYTVAASGAVTFDPVPTFVGTATPLTYRVADANGATATSTITITTTAVTPQANPDTRFTPYNTPVAVDVVAIPLFYSRGLMLTAGLYALFLLLAIAGLVEWRRKAVAAA